MKRMNRINEGSEPFYVSTPIKTMGRVTVEINGKKLELNSFAESVVESTVKGLLSSLRGYEEGEILVKIK